MRGGWKRQQKAWLRRWGSVCGVILCFCMGMFWEFPIAGVEIHWAEKDGVSANRYSPSYSSVSGEEVVMVYFGAMSCGFANDPALPEMVEQIKVGLQQKAVAEGASFSAIGVAVDLQVTEGIKYLSKFGVFDEIMTGRKWRGFGARLFFRELLSGVPATPQVLVYKQDVEMVGTTYLVFNEQVLVRKTGIGQIENWIEQGLPVPYLLGVQRNPSG